ncbi:MAG: T9SS C-terminal target domain-containing protein [Crocinitomicaceae bacterium]|nr:MAG: T9SS C-terminal target domain-containing protein [Crocinitomicaceae bacterium]
MNKLYVLLLLISSTFAFSQSYAPAPGNVGSTAIAKDSSCFVAWATGVQVTRGSVDISTPTLTFATFGQESYALGMAEGDGTSVVSLGDSGIAVVTFDSPITNDAGPDFAIFENGFADDYMEFAHVEVSSDGINFVRFLSHSESPVVVQLDNFMFGDCRMVNNLAGKYRQGFGTPFDLDELSGNPLLDVNAITHVKLIDVIGSISAGIGTTDALGNIINDPFPTPFESCGFDLDAVGVIHQLPLSISEQTISYQLYPNPTNDIIHLVGEIDGEVRFYSLEGKLLYREEVNGNQHNFSLKQLDVPSLIMEVQTYESVWRERIQIVSAH